MKTLIATLLLAGASLLGQTAIAGVSLSLAQSEELLAKSGFNAQLEQIEPAVQSGLNLTPGLAVNMPEADLLIIRQALATAFASDKLAADAKQQLPSLLTTEAAKSVLVWLDSELGKRITALEDESGKSEGFAERTEASAELFKKLPQRRIERYTELAKVLNAGEASATIAIDTTLATVRGAAALASSAPEENIAVIRKQLEQNRPKMVEQLNAQYLILFAGAYQTLEDKEIDQYIAFSGTPAGSAYNAALAKLLDIVMTHASLASGRLIAEAKKTKPAGS